MWLPGLALGFLEVRSTIKMPSFLIPGFSRKSYLIMHRFSRTINRVMKLIKKYRHTHRIAYAYTFFLDYTNAIAIYNKLFLRATIRVLELLHQSRYTRVLIAIEPLGFEFSP